MLLATLDQSAALFGECCFEVGDAKITMGTGCFIDVNTGSEVMVSKNAIHPLVAWKIGNASHSHTQIHYHTTTTRHTPTYHIIFIGDKCTYSVEAVVCPIGTVVDWAAKELGFFAKPQDSEVMAESVSDSNGVFFVPAFSGLDTPHADPTARGTILGIGTGKFTFS